MFGTGLINFLADCPIVKSNSASHLKDYSNFLGWAIVVSWKVTATVLEWFDGVGFPELSG